MLVSGQPTVLDTRQQATHYSKRLQLVCKAFLAAIVCCTCDESPGPTHTTTAGYRPRGVRLHSGEFIADLSCVVSWSKTNIHLRNKASRLGRIHKPCCTEEPSAPKYIGWLESAQRWHTSQWWGWQLVWAVTDACAT